MSRHRLVGAALAALALTAVTFAAQPAPAAPPAVAAPTRIMALGDSITGGPGCWRALLWDRLQRTGFTNIDFVGTLPGGGCSVAHDGDNEGHGGFLATGIANQNQLPGWLAATQPEIVLMHLGTNDVWNNIPAATILAAFSTLVDQMRAGNPGMRILVAQIIPMTPSGCTWCPPGVIALNNAIPGWAAGKSTAQSPITVVDQFTGFDTVADTNGDGVHPDDSGFQKISDRWYPALTPLLTGGTPGIPGPPGTPVASGVTASSVGLTWTASSGTVTNYQIERCQGATCTNFTNIANPAGTSFNDTGLAAATTYRYRARGVNQVGTGPFSTPILNVTTQSGGTGGCSATLAVQTGWGNGYVMQPNTVTNAGTSTISGWTVTFTLPAGHTIVGSWNATVTTSGQTVTARGIAGQNATLGGGASTTFGFQASRPEGNTALPAGATCTSP